MKKWIALLLAVLMLASFTACGENEQPDKEDNRGNDQANVQDSTKPGKEEPIPVEKEEEFDISNWGYSDSFYTDDGVKFVSYYINLPKFTGTHYMYGKISEQLDDTVVMISGQSVDSPSINDVSEIFEAHLDHTKVSLEAMYGIQSSNYNITIDSSEAVTVGDYDMYTHTGVITYDYDGTQRTHQYVAYATKLKANGACAYWLVYDFSEDQSKGDLIAEHAYHMAQTFREEE